MVSYKAMIGNFKKVIKKGEKYIVVENGKPEYVVMHYDDYADLVSREGAVRQEEMPQAASVGDFNVETILTGPNLPEDISKIRLEDLPL